MSLSHLIPALAVGVLLTQSLHTSVAAGQRRTAELPPVSYVCPMVGDEEVLEDKPGQCPKCKMTLVAVRLDSAWTCPNHPAVIATKGGKCPIDKRDLVQITVALHWTCPDSPGQRLTEPGRCADGKPRVETRELRAHGDHNPRHGGQFFMAQDNWHHLEGTYPRESLFRVFTYDNFTKPIDAGKFSGRIVTREERDSVTGIYKEAESFPLKPSRDGKTLDARVKSGKLPLTIAAKVRFDEKLPEQRFDFTFNEFSKEPSTARPSLAVTTTASASSPPSVPPTTTRAARRQAETLPAPTQAESGPNRTTPPPQATPSPATRAPTGPPSGLSAPSATPPVDIATTPASPVLTECAATMSRTDAEKLAEAVLPHTAGELVKLIALCGGTAQKLISDGQLGSVFLPAMLGKDIALALEGHINELPEQRKGEAASAIRRLVLAAWQLDAYGDLGNREKLSETYNLFAAAVADITSAYGAQQSQR